MGSSSYVSDSCEITRNCVEPSQDEVWRMFPSPSDWGSGCYFETVFSWQVSAKMVILVDVSVLRTRGNLSNRAAQLLLKTWRCLIVTFVGCGSILFYSWNGRSLFCHQCYSRSMMTAFHLSCLFNGLRWHHCFGIIRLDTTTMLRHKFQVGEPGIPTRGKKKMTQKRSRNFVLLRLIVFSCR